jgi:hypothetical protein
MAWAETQDLVEHAGRLGVELPALILNRVPPAAAENGGVRNAFANRFPDRRRAVVTDGAPPTGVEALRRLGKQLYGAS